MYTLGFIHDCLLILYKYTKSITAIQIMQTSIFLYRKNIEADVA